MQAVDLAMASLLVLRNRSSNLGTCQWDHYFAQVRIRGILRRKVAAESRPGSIISLKAKPLKSRSCITIRPGLKQLQQARNLAS